MESKTIRTIALVLGDNDYGNTFRPLLESMYRSLVRNELNCVPAHLEQTIRAAVEFHYLAFQVDYNTEKPGYRPAGEVLHYLQGKLKVLFNEDAEDNIAHTSYDSGAWYLNCGTGEVFAY